MFLTEDEVLVGYRHWSKYRCKIFNLFAVGWDYVTFSVNYFNPL